MTGYERNEEGQDSNFPAVNLCSEIDWPYTADGDRTTSSRSGCMEIAAMRKILQLWDVIERYLYGEVDTEFGESVSNECNQWRSQLMPLRIVGRCLTPGVPPNSNNEFICSASRKFRARGQSIEEMVMEDSLDGYMLLDMTDLAKYPSLVEDQKEVFDSIFEFVYSELLKQEKEENSYSSDGDLDSMLRIIPTPSDSGQPIIRSGMKDNLHGTQKIRTYVTRPLASEDLAGNGAKENNQTVPASSLEIDKNSPKNDCNRDVDEPETVRNKLGTVFNTKVVVTPSSFVVSQRQSFTTLRTTPINFRTQTFKISMPQDEANNILVPGLRRYSNSAFKMKSGQRMSGCRTLQSQSTWQPPVCQTAWPKTIKLDPIDALKISGSNKS